MEYISTSALANEINTKPSDLFEQLKDLFWIDRKNDKWNLTDLGRAKGGQTRTSTKFGEYIVWPENISIDKAEPAAKGKLINTTGIAKRLEVSSQRLNLIFSELGWVEKDIAGWQVTQLGKRLGGKQFEHDTSGSAYVLWPESILDNTNLKAIFNEDINIPIQRTPQPNIVSPNGTTSCTEGFRTRFPATFRTKDGHMVRSKAEVIIDNALYDYSLAHAYERKLPIDEDLYSDFFIPKENVYIEFWGMEQDAKYAERKKVKTELYKKYDFKLIELIDNDILNLDDRLPKKLLKYGIKVY